MGTDFEDHWTSIESRSFGSLEIHSLRALGRGEGQLTAILIPGLGASSETMLPTGRLLAQTRAVHILDLPGGAVSSRPARPLSLTDFADVCALWAEGVDSQRAVWIGHSFGSQVAVHLALNHPELVDWLALVSPTVDPRARTVTGQAARLLYDGLREPPRMVWLLGRDYFRIGLRNVLALGRLAIGDDIESELPLVAAPTLVLRGEKDVVVPEDWARRVADLLPDARLAVIPRAPHALPFAAPSELFRALQEFGLAR